MPKRAVDSMQVFANMPTRMIFSIPRCLSWASRSVLTKPLQLLLKSLSNELEWLVGDHADVAYQELSITH